MMVLSMFVPMGCQELGTTELLTVVPQDAGPVFVDAGPEPVDAGPPDTGVEDAGPPPRQLVTWNVLGTTPTSNLVLNPTFDLWAYLPMSVETMSRLHWPDTPTGLPVGQLSIRSQVFIPFQSTPGPVTAQVFIGRRTLPDQVSATVTLLGIGPTRREVAVELAQDEAVIEMDGVTWYRFSARTSARFLGHGVIAIFNDSRRHLFINGPVMMPVGPGALSVLDGARFPRRAFQPLSAAHRNAWRRLRAHQRAWARDRLGSQEPSRRP